VSAQATKASVRPRIGSIIWTDWPALFCALAIPGIWLISLLFPLIRRGATFGTFEVLTIAAPISVAAAGCLIWRIARIHRLFAYGRLSLGRVTSLRIARDRGRLEIEYDFEGQRHRSWMPIHKNKRVLALEPNQNVQVLVDPACPDKAIVRELYI